MARPSDGLSDVGNAYAFTGRRLDLESGLMQCRHRYYSPALGRFISRDPGGYADGHQLYQYAIGSPINAKDPSGLAADPRCVAAAKSWRKTCLSISKDVYRACEKEAHRIAEDAHDACDDIYDDCKKDCKDYYCFPAFR